MPRYQHYKKGHLFEVTLPTVPRRFQEEPKEWSIQVLVTQVLRVTANNADGGAVLGDEVVFGRYLVEAWISMAGGPSAPGSHTGAIAALMELAKMLKPVGVILQPLPTEQRSADGVGGRGAPPRRSS